MMTNFELDVIKAFKVAKCDEALRQNLLEVILIYLIDEIRQDDDVEEKEEIIRILNKKINKSFDEIIKYYPCK